MTSERIDYGRRAEALILAAEARSILSSETDSIEHPYWNSKTEFLESNPIFGEDRHMDDDDKNIDLMALVVLDEFPIEVRRLVEVKVLYLRPS
jgi:hypothetical protein